jgi:predicted protein tyrosine phosphatase
VCCTGCEEIEAIESQRGGLTLALDVPVAVERGLLEALLARIKKVNRSTMKQPTMCHQHIHAKSVICLDYDSPSLA